jgi:hypothetical protein
VDAVGKRLVVRGGDEGEQEAIVVPHEESALGLERRPEPEMPLVEVAAGFGVAHPQVQMVEVHGSSLPPQRRLISRERRGRPVERDGC